MESRASKSRLSAAPIYLRFKGIISGPFSAEHVKGLFQKRQIGLYHQFSNDKTNWKPLSNLIESSNGSPAASAQPAQTLDVLDLSSTETKRQKHIGPAASARNSAVRDLNSETPPNDEATPQISRRAMVLTAIFLGLSLITAATVVFWPRDHWEKDNSFRIIDLDDEVNQLISQKHWGKAITEVTAILDEIGNHPIDSGLIKAKLQDLAECKKNAEQCLDALGYQNMIASEDLGKRSQSEQRFQDASKAFDAALIIAHKIESVDPSAQGIRTRLEQEKLFVDRAFADAEVKRKNAEAAEAAALAQRQAAQAAALAQAKRDQEERQRQIEAANRLAAEVARQATITSFKNSSDYAAYKRDAEKVQTDLDTSLIGEDSAWRGMVKHTYAAMKMLGIWVEIEARLRGDNVDAQVQKVIQDVDLQQITEDSAIRAVAINEEGFAKMLGVWVDVLSKESPTLGKSYASRMLDMQRSLIGEDSAHRGEQVRSECCMDVLAMIVTNRGFGKEANSITTRVAIARSSETYAQAAAMRNVEGTMNLVLVLYRRVNRSSADSISRSVHLEVDSDESILRTHEGFKDGITRAFHGLIDSL